MSQRVEVERFLEGYQDDVAFPLRYALEQELPEPSVLVLVECGSKPERSLLHVSSDALVFYFVEVEGSSATVRTVRVGTPRSARVGELRGLKMSSTMAWLETTRLVAEHESFPGTRVECDCSLLEQPATERVRDLFRSWAEPAPGR